MALHIFFQHFLLNRLYVFSGNICQDIPGVLQSTNNGLFTFQQKKRAIIKGCEPKHLLRLSVLDFPLIVWMSCPVDDRIHPQLEQGYR